MAFQRSGAGCRGAQQRLELGKGALDRVEIRRVVRKVEQAHACALDCLANTGDLVCWEVVDDDDIGGRKLGHQYLLDISAEGVSVHGTIEDHGRYEPADPQVGR